MKNLKRQWVTFLVTISLAALAGAAMDDQSIRERTKPVGSLCLEGQTCGAAAVVAASGPKSAEDIYKSSCASCHGTGLLNAPRFGNAEDWAPRIAKGLGVLQTHAINGFNSMPPMGACAGCTEDDIRAVVEFLVERGK